MLQSLPNAILYRIVFATENRRNTFGVVWIWRFFSQGSCATLGYEAKRRWRKDLPGRYETWERDYVERNQTKCHCIGRSLISSHSNLSQVPLGASCYRVGVRRRNTAFSGFKMLDSVALRGRCWIVVSFPGWRSACPFLGSVKR